MIGAERVDRVHEREGLLHLRHVRRDGETLDLHRVLGGLGAEGRDAGVEALRQQVADALALADAAHQLEQGVGVAEARLEPVQQLSRDQAVLEALHEEGDQPAGLDRVQPVGVAALVGLGDRLDVVDAAARPEHADGLELGAAVGGVEVVAAAALDDALAAHDAREAGAGLLDHLRVISGAVDLVRALEDALGEVARDQAADVARPLDRVRGAELGELLEAGGLVGRLGAGREALDGVLVEVGVAALAAGDHGDEVLAAHHRAHAGTAGEVVHAVARAGEAHEAPAGGAVLQDLGAPVAELGPDGLLELGREQRLEVGGVAQLDLVVVHPEVAGLLGGALDHERVEARVLELRAEVAAALRVADAARDRRLGGEVEAGEPADRRPGEHARGHDQHVLGAQGVGAQPASP